MTTDEPGRIASTLGAALDEAGFGPVQTRTVPPSLEDVFVSMLGDDAEADHG
ncbi:MAG: hypothetical protein R3E53_00660 [Myxococcota bacterium]